MALSKEQMLTLYTNLVRADRFDKMMYRRMLQGKLIGFFHPGEGAIAPGVAAASFLNDDDNLSPHHRGHAIPHNLSKGIDMASYLAEHKGKEAGCCGGRSTFHWHFPEKKVYMMSGYIGFNFAPVVGWGWAAKRRNQSQVVMNCSGDGSYGQGRAHESMLIAMNMNLPIIYWCENNGMSIHATADEMHPTEDISSLAQGYGMPAVVVDGQDVFACAEVAIAAIDRARNGLGPSFVECKTLRFREHDMGTPDLEGREPRSEEKLAELRKRDPVILATKRVLEEEVLTQEQIDQIGIRADEEVARVEQFADDSPIAQPSEAELMAGVYAP
ncbi:MAG: thiamine pyrophosphate-dependent dehydrogenase E1 component subunit alpha [Congregibacter sp.]